MPLKALRIHEENGRAVARYEHIELNDLSPGDVVIRVSWSGINYKDALAATGAGKILRRYPLVGGIDLAGVVEQSSDARFMRGDRVLVTGCDLSETRDGGYAELARVPGDAVVPMPPGLDERCGDGNRNRRVHGRARDSSDWSRTVRRRARGRSSSPARPAEWAVSPSTC